MSCLRPGEGVKTLPGTLSPTSKSQCQNWPLFYLIRQQVVPEGFLVMRSVLEAHIFVPRKTSWACPVQRHQKDNIMHSAKQELTTSPPCRRLTEGEASRALPALPGVGWLILQRREPSTVLSLLFLLLYSILTILFAFLGFSSSPTLFFFLDPGFICSVIRGRLPWSRPRWLCGYVLTIGSLAKSQLMRKMVSVPY